MAIWAGKAEQTGTMNPYGEDFEFFLTYQAHRANQAKKFKDFFVLASLQ